MDWETFYNNFRQKDFIPGYEIQTRLGGGAFGDVYKAKKQSIGKSYAIKFLKVEDGQEGVVERELAQVGHFAAIDHPNLVTIEDMGVVMGVPYLIMGYAGNQTLGKRMKQGLVGHGEALDLFHQIARGVALLHEKQLVHFDLKPGNIFLQGGRARVGDYGLAKFFEQGNQSLSFGRGTPHYMAPEIMQGRGDHRADIYSFGVMLFECLVGKRPFLADNNDPMAIRQKEDSLPSVESMPETIGEVVHRCLRWNPEDRFSDMQSLIETLPQAPNSSTSSAADFAIVGPDGSSTISSWQNLEPESARSAWMKTSIFALLFLLLGFLFSIGGMAIVRTLLS